MNTLYCSLEGVWGGSYLFREVKQNNKPLPVLAADEITKLIVDGVFKPGDRLPNEYELAQRLGVGRSTVREAIKLLVSQNVLEIHRGNGTFVCEQTGVAADPLGLKFIPGKKKLGLDLCEIRFMIEPKIAMLAAQNATPEEVDQMQALCDEIRDQIYAGENYGEKDRELHTLIATCTRNSVIPNLIPILNEAIPLFIDITRQQVKMETIQTHQAVVDAIRARDPQAAYDAMWQHLVDNKRSIEAIPDDV